MEPVVQRFRAEYDPSAAAGMPAHVTVLHPWLPAGALDDATIADLGDVVRSVAAFDVTFTQLQRFPRTLWVAPSPPDPFIALTAAVVARWPECPPYGGEFDRVVPHLTVADGMDVDSLAAVVTAVAPALPVPSRVDAVSLMVRAAPDAPWERRAVLPLG